MSLWRIALARLRALWHRNAIADEIREEMESHLRMRAEAFVRDGLTSEDAHRKAARQFGNLAVLHDRGYDVRGGGLMESVGRDILYSLRRLRKAPAFAVVAIGVLALSISAGTTVFSLVDGVALRSLPFREPGRLMAIVGVDGPTPALSFHTDATTAQTFLDWRRSQHAFDAIAMDWSTSLPYRVSDGSPDDARAEQVTWEFFHVVRVAPKLGRLFTADDEIDGHNRVVILSHEFWQRRFGGALTAVGGSLVLNEQSWQVIGVLPQDFQYPAGSVRPAEIYVPRSFRQSDAVRGQGHNYNGVVIGRLKAGVSAIQAGEEINRITTALDRQYPHWEPGRRARVIPLREYLVGDVRTWLLMLLAAVSVVLLIACANVANLMLARASVRQHEIALHAALGASRARIVRAAVVDGIVLAGIAAVFGAALAYGGLSVLRLWLPAGIPRAASIALDLRVLGTEMATAVVLGIGLGLATAAFSSRVTATAVLRSAGRGTPSAASSRVRVGLVIAEVALAAVLLVGAGLFLGSFAKLMSVDIGFQYRNVLSIRNLNLRPAGPGVAPSRWTWSRSEPDEVRIRRTDTYWATLQEAISRVPGVTAVAFVDGGVPIEATSSGRAITIPGREGLLDVDRRRVSPNYFSLLGIPVIRGRSISAEDRAGTPLVALVNQFTAHQYWPDRDAMGQRVLFEGRELLIVGIVGDVHQLGPEKPPRHEIYVPVAQEETGQSTNVSIVARTAGNPLFVLPAVKAAIWSVNPDQHLRQDTFTLEGYMERMIAPRRFNMALIGLFGAVGLAIAAAGIFGVIAYSVSQRRNEIGVRISLGATPRRIMGLIVGQAARLILVGIAIGVVSAWYLTGFVQAFLFQIQPNDASVFGAAIGVLGVVGLVAATLPARRATKINPVESLRQD